MVVQSAGLTDDVGSHDGFRKIKSDELLEPSLESQNPILQHYYFLSFDLYKCFLLQIKLQVPEYAYSLTTKLEEGNVHE